MSTETIQRQGVITWEKFIDIIPESSRKYMNDVELQGWLDRKLKQYLAEKTVISYVPKFVEFCDFVSMSPTEIRKAVRHAEKEDDLDTWTKKLDRFYAKLVNEKGQKKSYVLAKLIVVNSFIKYCGVKLEYEYPEVTERDQEGHPIVETVFVPSVENVRLVYESTQDRELKAFIMIAKDSGRSEIDIMEYDADYRYVDLKNKVTYDSIRTQQLKGVSPLFASMIRQKTNRYSVLIKTFLGPETMPVLDTSTGKLFPWSSPRNLRRKFRELALRVDLPDITPKSLLAFYASAIRSIGMNELKAKVMMGHKIPKNDIEGKYVEFSREQLLPSYNEAYQYLRLFPGPKKADKAAVPVGRAPPG